MFDYKILTSNGFQDFTGIIQTKKPAMKITFNDDTYIICSYEHKFYENEMYIPAYTLKINNILSNKKIKKLEDIGEQILYDILDVDNGHHFSIILDNGNVESSNCAFVPVNIWKQFWTSTYPTITAGKESQMIITSTPNGQNHFYQMWIGATQKKNGYFPNLIEWWQVPGRTLEWKQEILKSMSEEQFLEEYGNSFNRSENSLLSTDTIAIISQKLQEPIEQSKTVKIYEPPQKNHTYFASVDCASVGEDYSVMTVLDITQFPYKQVAVFADNEISYMSFPQVIVNMAQKYNECEVLIESNDIGNTVLHILNYELEYDNLTKTKRGHRVDLGQRTTSKTKSKGCASLKSMLESEQLIINDKDTLDEFRHFVLNGVSYSAENGFHDDRVMTLVNACYVFTELNFKLKYDQDFIEEYQKKYSDEIYDETFGPLQCFSDANFNSYNGLSKEDIQWFKD